MARLALIGLLIAASLTLTACEQKAAPQDEAPAGAKEATEAAAADAAKDAEEASAGDEAEVSAMPSFEALPALDEIKPPELTNPDDVLRTLHVTGMTCSGCEQYICETLQKIEGVHVAKASHKAERAWVVVAKDGPTDEQLMEAINGLGRHYKASPVSETGLP